MPKLKPQQACPELTFLLLGGDEWDLHTESIDNLLMIVVYRGLHCPVCKSYLRQLDRMLGEYVEIGVSVVTVSADPAEAARQSAAEWGIENLRIGYGLTETQMHDWDMFVSRGIKESETAIFAEPAVFLVRSDRTLYYIAHNSMPFGRPDLKQLVGNIKWLLDEDYPARGES